MMIKDAHYSKGTGKLYLRFVKNHVMKAYGAGSTAPHILNLFTRCAKKKSKMRPQLRLEFIPKASFTMKLLGQTALNTSVWYFVRLPQADQLPVDKWD
jgi:hypothetical protein